MSVLVDSSVWIDYFRNRGQADYLEFLIEENLVVTNELILTELIPLLHIQRQKKLISLLKELKRQPMRIAWEEIIHMQTLCLRKGVQRIGIPDLIIAQNAVQGALKLLSNDRHFVSLSRLMPLELFS